MIDKTRIYNAITKANLNHELMFGVYLDYSTGDYSHCEELICVVNTLNEAQYIAKILEDLDIRGWYNSKSTIKYRADIDNFTTDVDQKSIESLKEFFKKDPHSGLIK